LLALAIAHVLSTGRVGLESARLDGVATGAGGRVVRVAGCWVRVGGASSAGFKPAALLAVLG
jgi:hypothetical protein